MIVADASGLVALGSVEAICPFVDGFHVRTTPAAMESIEGASGRHGPRGDGARATLAVRDQLGVVAPAGEPIVTSRLDRSAGSCIVLTRELDAAFYLTDERRAIHEVRKLVPGDVVTPDIGLAALVRVAGVTRQDAGFRHEALLDRRRGLDAAIGERMGALFEPVDGGLASTS